MEYSRKELKLIAEAWECMTEQNLSCIAHSFSKAMTALSRIAFETEQSADWKRKHIVVKLYADRISELTQV